jgi:RimJ/RimL family protein N-acetyltransferase
MANHEPLWHMPITTDRLVIRSIMPGDGKLVFDAVEESRSEFIKWLPWVSDTKSFDDSEKVACEFYDKFHKREAFHGVLFAGSKLIGMTAFNTINLSERSGIMGYWCRQSEQGKGYILEAMKALTEYGFSIMGLRQISLLCYDSNLKSISVAERSGFHLIETAYGLLENVQGTDPVLCRLYQKNLFTSSITK